MYEIKPDILIKMIWFFPDFSNITDGPPTLCGYDVNTGEDKFCCKDLDPSNLRVSMPQSPLFPETNSGSKSVLMTSNSCSSGPMQCNDITK